MIFLSMIIYYLLQHGCSCMVYIPGPSRSYHVLCLGPMNGTYLGPKALKRLPWIHLAYVLQYMDTWTPWAPVWRACAAKDVAGYLGSLKSEGLQKSPPPRDTEGPGASTYFQAAKETTKIHSIRIPRAPHVGSSDVSLLHWRMSGQRYCCKLQISTLLSKACSSSRSENHQGLFSNVLPKALQPRS